MYIDRLDDIVNKYNNTHHSIIEMEPVNGQAHIVTLIKKTIRRTLNLKLVII